MPITALNRTTAITVTAARVAIQGPAADDNATTAARGRDSWNGREERRRNDDRQDRRASGACRRAADQVRRRMIYGLEQLVWDGTPVPPPARIVAASRVFSEGTCYFSGTLVNRFA
jgi:hypothetical protein